MSTCDDLKHQINREFLATNYLSKKNYMQSKQALSADPSKTQRTFRIFAHQKSSEKSSINNTLYKIT